MRLVLTNKGCRIGKLMQHHQSFSSPPLSFAALFSSSNKERCVAAMAKCKPLRAIPWEKKAIRKSAVLVPLCIVNDEPSMLFTLRSNELTKHKGQVRLVQNIYTMASNFCGLFLDLWRHCCRYIWLHLGHEDIMILSFLCVHVVDVMSYMRPNISATDMTSVEWIWIWTLN